MRPLAGNGRERGAEAAEGTLKSSGAGCLVMITFQGRQASWKTRVRPDTAAEPLGGTAAVEGVLSVAAHVPPALTDGDGSSEREVAMTTWKGARAWNQGSKQHKGRVPLGVQITVCKRSVC